jgi:pseudaminic acid biosynthesis-associated methylase
MSDQLKVWESEFGTAYTDRNKADWRARVPIFKRLLEGLPIRRVLEVGCNRGHNLVALADLLGDDSEVVAVEPNQYARETARASSSKIGVLRGNAYDLPFRDGYFDLAFTSGVLIHIPLAELPKALGEIYRVSGRYILAIEYFAEKETPIPYHGHSELLWKRDFPNHYRQLWPNLKLVREGYIDAEADFDQTHWWLFEK